MKRSRGEEGPLCKTATQQEGGSLGGWLRRTSRAGRGTNERQRASDSARAGGTSRSKEREKGGCSGPAPIRREVDNRGKRRGFGKEELKKGEAKLQNKNSNLIQERFR